MSVFLRDENGEIRGGVLGNLMGDWLYVGGVWVEKRIRGRGLATKLLIATEQHALSNGCINAALNTFTFQARPLCEKLGYRVFGESRDRPVVGHSNFLMSKRLTIGE